MNTRSHSRSKKTIEAILDHITEYVIQDYILHQSKKEKKMAIKDIT